MSNSEIDATTISNRLDVSASVNDDTGNVIGAYFRINESNMRGEDWLNAEKALELRDWLNKHFDAKATAPELLE